MNKRGQVLITFVLVLPLIILFVAYFADSSILLMEKNKVSGILESNMKTILEKNIRDINKIEKIIKDNDDSLNVVVNINNDLLIINVSSTKKRLFNIKTSQLQLNYCGNYLDKKIDKKCEKKV